MMETPMPKPPNYYTNILAIDCETTGINFKSNDPSVGQQALSWGLIVADTLTFTPIEKLYLEVKWNDTSKKFRNHDPSYGKYAEKIHGLSLDYLEKTGIEEEDAVIEIVSLILKYWGPDTCVHTLGHNVHLFDMPFLRSTCARYGIPIKFGNRHIDTSSIGLCTVGAYDSDSLFEAHGFEDRKDHNAMTDIEQTLEVARNTKVLWQQLVGVKV